MTGGLAGASGPVRCPLLLPMSPGALLQHLHPPGAAPPSPQASHPLLPNKRGFLIVLLKYASSINILQWTVKPFLESSPLVPGSHHPRGLDPNSHGAQLPPRRANSLCDRVWGRHVPTRPSPHILRAVAHPSMGQQECCNWLCRTPGEGGQARGREQVGTPWGGIPAPRAQGSPGSCTLDLGNGVASLLGDPSKAHCRERGCWRDTGAHHSPCTSLSHIMCPGCFGQRAWPGGLTQASPGPHPALPCPCCSAFSMQGTPQ